MLVPAGDANLWVETGGKGSPLVTFHGIGLDHSYFRPYFAPIEKECRVVYFDQRGNGRSSSVQDWSEIDHSTWVQDADILRTNLGHEKVVVFGHSYGGFLAQEYALAHPDRVAGLVLCCTAPAMDFWPEAMANARARSTDDVFQVLAERLSKPIGSDEGLKEAWHRVLPLYFSSFKPEYQRVLSSVHFSSGAFNRAFFGCLAGFDVRKAVGSITAPVLLLAGRHDWIMPPAQGAERLRSLVPHSECVIFEKSGHFPFVEEEAAFVQSMTGWIRRITARS